MTAADIGDPEADAVILFREGELNDNTAEGTSLKVYLRIKVFNDRGRRFADVQLPYTVGEGKITDLEARTIRPDGTTVEVNGRDFYDKVISNSVRAVRRARAFSMPAVEAGSIIEYRYRLTYPKGFRYFAIDIQSELFTKDLHYSIQPKAGSSSDLRWVVFNAPDPARFSPVWDGDFDITVKDIPPFRREPLMAPEATVKIWGWLFYSNEFETEPDRYWPVYARRMHLRAGDETKPTATIRRVVNSITLSTDGPREKTARIYSYVQREIENVGVPNSREGESGTDGPWKKNNTADDTIRRRYGTPREINRLFIAMLRAAGLDARVGELTTRDENFFHRKFADSLQLNSEVTAVLERDGTIGYFDPGTPHCPSGMLSWDKEGVPVLIYGNRDYRFSETPVREAGATVEDRRISLVPSPDGRVEVKVDSEITGHRALELRTEMAELTPDQQRKLISSRLRGLHPTAALDESTVAIGGLTTPSLPLTLRLMFSDSQLATWTERRLLLRPAFVSRRNESLLPAPKRVNSLYFQYPWSENDRAVIEVPEGYEVEHLPEPVEINIGAAHYRGSFLLEGNRVIYERRFAVDAIIFTADQYPVVKAFFDQVRQADNTQVAFRR